MEKKYILIGMIFLVMLMVKHVDATWAESSWGYCRNITINNTLNATLLTNYEVGINITNMTNFMANASDVRFVNASCNNGGSELNHWQETYVSGSWDYEWVQVDSIPASGLANISIYYNNSAATSTSNANTTFVFGDAFDGTTLNTTKWGSIINAVNISYTVGNGYLNVTGFSPFPTTAEEIYLHSLTEIADNYIFEGSVKANTSSNSLYQQVGIYIDNQTQGFDYSGGNVIMNNFQNNGGDPKTEMRVERRISGTYTEVYKSGTAMTTNWRNYGVSRIGTNFSFYMNRTFYSSMAHTKINNNPYVGIRTVVNSVGESWIWDWFIVRKFILPEPTNSIAAEQAAPVADTCTYASGNWNINIADKCNITTATNVTGNVFIYGNGTTGYTLFGSLNFTKFYVFNNASGIIAVKKGSVFKSWKG